MPAILRRAVTTPMKIDRQNRRILSRMTAHPRMTVHKDHHVPSLDPRKLLYFLTAVDCGSYARAARELGVSQSTLSEHVSSLELYLGRPLLTRGQAGVSVTEAGKMLYRHAQLIVRQVRQAEQDVTKVSSVAFSPVSLGLATYGAASTLALPILRRVMERCPDVLLRINDNFAGTLSDSLINGRIDLAVVYGAGPIKGVRLRSLFAEELFLFASESATIPGPARSSVVLSDLAGMRLLLPSNIHFLRNVIEAAFTRIGVSPQIAVEIDSFSSLRDALRANLGVSILPRAAFAEAAAQDRMQMLQIRQPRLEAVVSLGTSEQLPVTDSVRAVEGIILELVGELTADGMRSGIRALAHTPGSA